MTTMEECSKCELLLDLSHDLLALYTPPPRNDGHGSRLNHTRSVLLAFSETSNQMPVIVDGLLFALVFSMPERVDFDRLLKYMLVTYARRLYSRRSKASIQEKHMALDDMEPHLMDNETKRFIRRQDAQNVDDFIYCHKANIFHDDDDGDDGNARSRWRWHPVNSDAIFDNHYATMKNINFIRGATPIEVKRPTKGERQYRVLFDNHVILYFFLQHFRHEIDLYRRPDTTKHDDASLHQFESAKECEERERREKLRAPVRITLLEPLDMAHDVFHGEDYVRYVEKQLDRREAHELALHLSFKNSIVLAGGLLQPAYYDREDVYLSCANTPEEMYARRLVEDVNRRKNKRDPNVVSFTLAYNRLFVSLRQWQVAHVDYNARTKLLMSHDMPLTPTVVKKDTIITAPQKSIVKRARDQPTLGTIVQTFKENNPNAIFHIHPPMPDLPLAPQQPQPQQKLKPKKKKEKKRKQETTLLTLFEAQKRPKLDF